MGGLLDSIRADHAKIGARLELLRKEVEEFALDRTADVGLLDLLAQFFAAFPDEIHHRKEGFLYYALIRQGVAETAYLRRLKDEHGRMEEAAARFAEDLHRLKSRGGAASPALIARIGRYAAFLQLHMADEESQFLPLVEQRLAPERLLEIEMEAARELTRAEAQRSLRKIAAIDAEIDAHIASRLR